MEKIKLKEDLVSSERLIREAASYVAAINKLIKDVNQIAPLRWTRELAMDLAQSNDAEHVANAVKENVINYLDAAKIPIRSIRDAAVNQALEDSYKLFNEYKKHDMDAYKFTAYIVFDGVVKLKSGFENEVKEQFTTYIKTEGGKKIYDLTLNVVNAVNDLKNALPDSFHLDVRGGIEQLYTYYGLDGGAQINLNAGFDNCGNWEEHRQKMMGK